MINSLATPIPIVSMATVTSLQIYIILYSIIVKKTSQFTMPFKDDMICQLADLKQQMAQKMILLCST